MFRAHVSVIGPGRKRMADKSLLLVGRQFKTTGDDNVKFPFQKLLVQILKGELDILYENL